jgi:aspartate/tyrosine/aromatic aminotransferase
MTQPLRPRRLRGSSRAGFMVLPASCCRSNPPVHGARIVAEVVGDEAVFNEWRAEMEGMAGRIKVAANTIR